MENFKPLNAVATERIIALASLSKRGDEIAKKTLAILDRNNPKHLQIISKDDAIDIDQLPKLLNEAA